ncbi:NAD(+)/NADH kinase [Halalkalicoccus jeotgali]|uniref:ATP-NAD/AcoX kinase n=1 Tax=Halalkalicoccus jeotgali (strain DSM 18796 / CECT 7217 / JCM 14584 / KCTC 4019 / B3) TaxID=795797 RepID=D8J4Y3_HALJB|nr:NAD(+)/NADH kinase [Halalkalicoccus jeotgali]ADJ15600.1 ATP-NAD/AcoX kinase [Halalkalicoccus jeotgali B3]ELY36322.1 ATP-NAD/AcoX kinase [Halalkalicoccus jeotgali B3]
MRAIPGESAVTVLVVGASSTAIEAIEAAGHTVRTGVPADLDAESGDGDPDPDFEAVVAIGESALLAVARRRPSIPVLPVDVPIGPDGADRRAIGAALAGEAPEHASPVLSVSVDGETIERAVMDVTLVTTEPARISEYAVHRTNGRVAAFRADGVVVATPAGSHGYAAAAGGPTFVPGTEAFSIVPIAPFHTQSSQWVVDTGPLSLSVLRDEGEVSLLVDDTDRGVVDPNQRVRLEVDDYVRTLRP